MEKERTSRYVEVKERLAAMSAKRGIQFGSQAYALTYWPSSMKAMLETVCNNKKRITLIKEQAILPCIYLRNDFIHECVVFAPGEDIVKLDRGQVYPTKPEAINAARAIVDAVRKDLAAWAAMLDEGEQP